MASFPRTLYPNEVTSLSLPGPLLARAQSGRINTRSTQQIGHSWTERFLVNVRSVNGRALIAAIENYWRNGTIFTISHLDHLTPVGAGGGSPLVNAATQLVTDPENFGAWADIGTPILTSGQSDPLGGTAAYLINDNDGAVLEGKSEAITFTGDAVKAMAVYVKQGSSTKFGFGLRDTAAAAYRLLIDGTWTAGVPVLAISGGAGTATYSVVDAGGGWYRVMAASNSVTAANAHTIRVFPVDVSSGAATGTTYFFGANAWDEVSPARYSGPSQPGNAATGSDLYTNGATASVSNWLRAGDIISAAGAIPIRQVTADVSTQANGFAVIPVNPPYFSGGSPADNAAVTITGVTLSANIVAPPDLPNTSGQDADYGTIDVSFAESL